MGRDDGAHRAGRRVGRRRGPHPGRRAARRHLAPRRGEAVHHRGRARPRREHRAPRAGPPGGPGHPAPPAPRACRCSSCRSSTSTPRPTLGERNGAVRHERRAQDGAQGVRDLRADVRAARRSRGGPPAGRGARRHRADVRGDRVRPDDGGHQGHRRPVGGLPDGAGLREGAGAGRTSPGPPTRAPPRDDHPPRGRAPHADAAEVVRRRAARALPLRGDAAGRRAGRWPGRPAGRRGQRPAAADRQGRGQRAGVGDARALAADPRRLGLSPGLPGRAVRPRREDRLLVREPPRSSRSTCSSARSSETAAGRSGTSSSRSRRSSTRRAATAGSRRRALLATALADVRGMLNTHRPRRRGRPRPGARTGPASTASGC